ncbi:unnamed protein product [Mucor hiemalis]
MEEAEVADDIVEEVEEMEEMEQSEETEDEASEDEEYVGLVNDGDELEGEDFDEVLQNLNIDLNAEDAPTEDSTDQTFSSQERLNDIPSSPMEPLSLLFVIMMHMLIGRYIADEGAEIIMAFLNVALALVKNAFRFPVKLSTFVNNSRFEERACPGMRTYVSCITCHSIYDIPGNINERRERLLCTFAKRVSHDGSRVLKYCDTPLYDVNANNSNSLVPMAIYMYNSVIETLKKFYMRDGFFEAVSAWKRRKLVHLNYGGCLLHY